MPKVFYCSKCTGEHSRPVGKKCQRDIAGESFSSADEVAVPPSPSSEITVSDQILRQLRVLGDKMDSMDKRVQRTEAALEQGSSQASLLHSSSHKSSNHATVSHGSDTASNSAESVVPSMEYLRSNESLQVRLKNVWQILRTSMRLQLEVGLSPRLAPKFHFNGHSQNQTHI